MPSNSTNALVKAGPFRRATVTVAPSVVFTFASFPITDSTCAVALRWVQRRIRNGMRKNCWWRRNSQGDVRDQGYKKSLTFPTKRTFLLISWGSTSKFARGVGQSSMGGDLRSLKYRCRTGIKSRSSTFTSVEDRKWHQALCRVDCSSRNSTCLRTTLLQ